MNTFIVVKIKDFRLLDFILLQSNEQPDTKSNHHPGSKKQMGYCELPTYLFNLTLNIYWEAVR